MLEILLHHKKATGVAFVRGEIYIFFRRNFLFNNVPHFLVFAFPFTFALSTTNIIHFIKVWELLSCFDHLAGRNKFSRRATVEFRPIGLFNSESAGRLLVSRSRILLELALVHLVVHHLLIRVIALIVELILLCSIIVLCIRILVLVIVLLILITKARSTKFIVVELLPSVHIIIHCCVYTTNYNQTKFAV